MRERGAVEVGVGVGVRVAAPRSNCHFSGGLSSLEYGTAFLTVSRWGHQVHSSVPVSLCPPCPPRKGQDMMMRGPWQVGMGVLRLPSPLSLLPEDPKSLLLVQIGRLHPSTP